MEAKLPKIFARFDSLNRPIGTRSNKRPHCRSAFQPRHSDAQSDLGFAAANTSILAEIEFCDLRLMLSVMYLEIYCCLSVAEIGIVAWSCRTDVASGKEVSVSESEDEKSYCRQVIDTSSSARHSLKGKRPLYSQLSDLGLFPSTKRLSSL